MYRNVIMYLWRKSLEFHIGTVWLFYKQFTYFCVHKLQDDTAMLYFISSWNTIEQDLCKLFAKQTKRCCKLKLLWVFKLCILCQFYFSKYTERYSCIVSCMVVIYLMYVLIYNLTVKINVNLSCEYSLMHSKQ